MSAFGTKRTFCAPDRMSAFGGKADIWETSTLMISPSARSHPRELARHLHALAVLLTQTL